MMKLLGRLFHIYISVYIVNFKKLKLNFITLTWPINFYIYDIYLVLCISLIEKWKIIMSNTIKN